MKKYQVIIVWSDCSSKTVSVNTLEAAKDVIMDYLLDPDLSRISVYSWITRRTVIEIGAASERKE